MSALWTFISGGLHVFSYSEKIREPFISEIDSRSSLCVHSVALLDMENYCDSDQVASCTGFEETYQDQPKAGIVDKFTCSENRGVIACQNYSRGLIYVNSTSQGTGAQIRQTPFRSKMDLELLIIFYCRHLRRGFNPIHCTCITIVTHLFLFRRIETTGFEDWVSNLFPQVPNSLGPLSAKLRDS